MKIESILLENFGIYGSKRFRFDGHPLVLIYGANESGKTTALNGLRQALFGFPRQSAYLTGKPMSAEGTVLLSDGRRIRFNRQKKNSDGFIATIDGKIPLAEADWLNLAGGLDLKSYQSLFGFSLDELRSGEKALAHAPIDEALSSSGFGGLARLQKVQHRIEEFLNQSLKRAGLSGSINAKLSEIEEAERHLESVLTLPADVGALRSRVADAQQLVQQYTEQMDALRSRLIICQRQQAALPRAIEYKQVQQSLAEYAIPPAVDDEFRVQWTVANNRLAGARSELVTEHRRLEQLEQELAGLPVVQEAALLQTEAISLGNQARQVPFWRQQVADCQREIAELDRELGDSLRKLGWSRQDQRWRSIQLDLNQQAEISGAIQTIDKLTSQLAQCQTRIDVAEKQLHMHRPPHAADADSLQHQDANAIPNPSLSWDRIVEIETQLRALRPLFHNWEQLNRQLQQSRTNRRAMQLADELRALTSDLCREASSVSSGELTGLDGISVPDTAASVELRSDWQVPTTGEVALRAQRLTATATECARLQDQLATLKRQQSALECEIQAVQAGSGIKTLVELESMWRERDQIVAHWREELRTPLLAAAVTPSEYEQRLLQLKSFHEQSDAAVRSLLAAVEQVAELAGRQREIAALDNSCRQLESQIQAAERQGNDAQLAWAQLWSDCPFGKRANNNINNQCLTPEQLTVWLELYAQWRQHQFAEDALVGELQLAQQRRDDGWQSLVKIWPEAARMTTPGDAEQSLSRIRSAKATADAQTKLLKEVEATYSSSLQARGTLERQLTVGQTTYQQTIAAFGLPDTWLTSELAPRLESLRRCQVVAERIDQIRQRQQAIGQQIEQFTASVKACGARLGTTTPTGSAEEQALIWLDQFANSQRIQQRRLELGKLLEAQRAACDKRISQIKQLDSAIEQMVVAVEGQSREQVQTWINQSASVFQLRAKQAQLRAALESNADGQPLDVFLGELAELSAKSVTAGAATLTAQLSALEASANSAQQALGGLARELECKEQGSAALDAEQRLKRLRSELVELSEQWVVHRLAGELLARTIDRFTRDHEPQLIKHTRRFFKELTDDRYCMVEHDSGKHGGFAVRDAHGNAWQPDKLSTGTREQLYLAIRLAFITHFNEQHEPLPVIMDDCFVNFDDARARIALRTLIHWQESVQTILLSCHWRSVEALAELAPDTPVITLASGELTTARLLADRNPVTLV